jgi:glucose-1-phosphate thymidylyltransferase
VKGLILSGGKGTRLRPLTYTSAKQLVPVANKPVLFYGIEAMAAAGIRDLGIVVGETHEEIRAAVGDGSRWGVKATYIMQPDPLGLAHAVKISREFLRDSPFVMYLGDNLLAHGIESLVREFEATRPDALILLAHVPNPSQFGVAELAGDRVVCLREKPPAPKSDLALVGVYMFTAPIFEAVEAIQPSARGELEITDAIQYLVDKGYTVSPHIVTGWWKDTGKLGDMLEANRLILETLDRRLEGEVRGKTQIDGRVVLEASALIEDSVVRGPVIIGPGSRVVRAYVGPFTSIGPDVTIQDSEIEHSIVLEGSKILDLQVRVEDSLIGRGCRILRTPVMPRALRLMVGDRSEVGIS